MSKITLQYPLETARGKIKFDSNVSLCQRGNTQYSYTRQNDRDYTLHPKTETEAANQTNFGDAVRAYRELKKNPQAYADFLQQYNQAKSVAEANNRPFYSKPYTYFISTRRK